MLAMLAWLAGRSGRAGRPGLSPATAQPTEPLGSCRTVLRGRRESSACVRSSSYQAVRGAPAPARLGVLEGERAGRSRAGERWSEAPSLLLFGELAAMASLFTRLTARESVCRRRSRLFHFSPGVTISMKLRRSPDLKSLASSSPYNRLA